MSLTDARHIKRNIKSILKTAPIYLSDTHGYYSLDNEPVPWIVPENTLIFETQTITNFCLTSINQPLWVLATYRDLFTAYFLGDTAFFEKRRLKKEKKYIQVFKNMTFYKPGDTIYQRTLSIGGGKGERRLYSSMGFYAFDPSTKVHTMPGVGTRRSENEILSLLRNDLIENPDKTITNKYIVDQIPQDGPRIFIFSSCAEVLCDDYSSEICIKRILEIHKYQQLQAARLLESNIHSNLVESNSNTTPEYRDIDPDSHYIVSNRSTTRSGKKNKTPRNTGGGTRFTRRKR